MPITPGGGGELPDINAGTVLGNGGTVAGQAYGITLGAGATVSVDGQTVTFGGGGLSIGEYGVGSPIPDVTQILTVGASIINQGGGAVVMLIDSGTPTLAAGALFGNGGTAAGAGGDILGIGITVSGTTATTDWNAGVVTDLGTGLDLTGGTLSVEALPSQSVTLAGTSGGTLSINPGIGTQDVLINLAASGGTQTLSYTGADDYQSFIIHIKQGATASVLILNTGTVNGFVFGATQGPTGYTITPTPNVTDDIFCKGITTAYARVYALDQGFAN